MRHVTLARLFELRQQRLAAAEKIIDRVLQGQRRTDYGAAVATRAGEDNLADGYRHDNELNSLLRDWERAKIREETET